MALGWWQVEKQQKIMFVRYGPFSHILPHIVQDQDELEENETVLDDCQYWGYKSIHMYFNTYNVWHHT